MVMGAWYSPFEQYNLTESEQASSIFSLFPGLKGLLATPSPGLALAAQRCADLKKVWNTCYEDKRQKGSHLQSKCFFFGPMTS